MSKGTPLLAAALAFAAYLAVSAEPDTTEAPAVAVAPTNAAPAVAVEIVGNDNRKPALAEPVVVESIYWRTDFNAAVNEAAVRRKPLVRLVTNVATCAPCRALEAGPLSDQATIQWLNRNVVMTQRLPRRGESIPFFEVQVRPNVWRPVRIATMSTRTFLNWFREVVR